MTKNSGIRKPWMAEKTIPKAGILPTIRDHPVRREEREGSVQDDPQQHGAGPQGVQVGSSGEGGVFGAHGRRSPDLARY